MRHETRPASLVFLVGLALLLGVGGARPTRSRRTERYRLGLGESLPRRSAVA